MRQVLALAVGALLAGCASGGRRAACPCPCPCEPAVVEAPPASPYLDAARRTGDGNAAVWTFLRGAYDRDGDGRVTAAEYPRRAEAFARWDVTHDGALTAADFEGPTTMESYLADFVWRRLVAVAVPGADPEASPLDAAALAKAFAVADANGNGRVGERELLAELRATDANRAVAVPPFPQGVAPFPVLLAVHDVDRSGDLSLAEVEAWRAKAAAEEAKSAATAGAAPTKAAVAARRRGIDVGEPAFEFTLKTADGRSEVSLASFRGVKPVVLVFGSYTCPPFRHLAPRLRAIEAAHAADVQFLFVYIREAHAVDGRAPMPSPTQPLVEEPLTLDERRLVASSCLVDLGFHRFPTLVDGIGDEVGRAYAAAPARIYVVGRDLKVAYRSAPGPFGLDADALEQAIRDASRPPAPASAANTP